MFTFTLGVKFSNNNPAPITSLSVSFVLDASESTVHLYFKIVEPPSAFGLSNVTRSFVPSFVNGSVSVRTFVGGPG